MFTSPRNEYCSRCPSKAPSIYSNLKELHPLIIQAFFVRLLDAHLLELGHRFDDLLESLNARADKHERVTHVFIRVHIAPAKNLRFASRQISDSLTSKLCKGAARQPVRTNDTNEGIIPISSVNLQGNKISICNCHVCQASSHLFLVACETLQKRHSIRSDFQIRMEPLIGTRWTDIGWVRPSPKVVMVDPGCLFEASQTGAV